MARGEVEMLSDIEKERTGLRDRLDSWCREKGLMNSYAMRNIQQSNKFFYNNKNDCRIYSKNSVGKGTVDSRPHFSVWLYLDFATVFFCVDTKNNQVISRINDKDGKLIIEEYDNDKRMHYKLKEQSDIKIDSKTNFVDAIINQLDQLYNELVKYNVF